MWDSKTLTPIKTIDVDGGPDGILGDPSNGKIYVLSHREPNVIVIDAAEGTVTTTVNVGGAPEQSVVDDKGHLYVTLEDKDKVAVVDTKTWKVTGTYDLAGKGGTPAGLAIDVKNRILFVACRNPATMVMMKADDGTILATLPLGAGTDGAVFNPATMEAFSSQGDGTLTVIKENNPTTFVVEQTVTTPVRAKTLTLDSKTNNILLITAEFAAPPAPAAPPAAGGRGGGRGALGADIFAIGLGVEEGTSYGTPAYKVRGKLVGRLREDGETLVVGMDFEQRDELLAADPDTYYLTDHYRNYPWILVRLPRVHPDALRDLLGGALRRAGRVAAAARPRAAGPRGATGAPGGAATPG